MRPHLLVVPLLVCAAARAAALPAGVTGIRAVGFGTLLPGIPTTVVPTDPSNSGQFNFTGKKNELIYVTLSLPATMTGPAGATLPLTFGGSAGGYSAAQSTGSETAFDPKVAQTFQLSNSGRGSVFLGGTASPAVNQRAGSYSGTITLSVTFL
ncbi:MAG TPA: DUF4402 domain-containing protein [Gemmatimonadales bacterium]|nr:DUF4402 domain-containing protein [Gemmatimonadales bacterium]